jgi:precorrin-6A/cobalt-precorrin-6A reductase
MFARAPQHHYLVRSVEPVDPPLAVAHAAYVTGRGPFTEVDDRALLIAHSIDVIVAKNSGGTATYGKIAAARSLGLPVIMLRRPGLPEVPTVEAIEDVMTWLDHAVALRGV